MNDPIVDSKARSKSAAVVLAIGGSDNSAGAGVQADIKSGAACGAYVCTVITAITAQNPERVAGVYPVPIDQVASQWQSIVEAFPIGCVKVGMLPSAELVAVLSSWLMALNKPVVVDPVLSITSGFNLENLNGLVPAYQQHLLPVTTLLTPNLAESAQLLGCAQASTFEDLESQAQALQKLGVANVLLKGGHLQGALAADVLVADKCYPFSAPRINTENTHGTGCTLASAIAAGLAQGLSVEQSVAVAKSYVQSAIQASDQLNLAQSNGPLHHFHSYW